MSKYLSIVKVIVSEDGQLAAKPLFNVGDGPQTEYRYHIGYSGSRSTTFSTTKGSIGTNILDYTFRAYNLKRTKYVDGRTSIIEVTVGKKLLEFEMRDLLGALSAKLTEAKPVVQQQHSNLGAKIYRGGKDIGTPGEWKHLSPQRRKVY